MIEFKNIYEFYKLTRKARRKLLGSILVEKDNPSVLYFVLDLENECFNYGSKEGLIRFSPIITYKEKKWFRISAFSPDDLDIDLDFNDQEIYLYDQILKYVKTEIKKKDVTYEDFLLDIQTKFGAGKRTCY